MFTRNAYKAFTLLTHTADRVTVKNAYGTEVTCYKPETNRITSFQPGYLINSPRTSIGQGVVFGTGTTPATFDDYTLLGEVVKTVSFNTTTTREVDDSGSTATAVYTIINNETTDVTIGEIGMFCFYYTGQASTGGQILLERTVLDEPVTIPANGVGQVTYTVRMDWPT
jgi:hypothetical protein